jgi:hypothetical protein
LLVVAVRYDLDFELVGCGCCFRAVLFEEEVNVRAIVGLPEDIV